MKKRYKISCGFDFELTLEIDTDVMDAELAKEVNDFWTGKEEVLEASDGDIYQAVARRAAPVLWSELFDGWGEELALKELSDSEGWPPNHGIKIINYAVPEMDAVDFDVETLS